MTSMSRMIAIRAVIVVLALIILIGFLPTDAGNGTTVLSKYKGFLRPRAVPASLDVRVESSPEGAVLVVEDKNTDQKTEEQAKFEEMYDFSEKTEGDVDAPLKLYVFSSLTCSHCAHFQKDYLPFLREKYVQTGRVLLIHKDFPLDGRATVASLISRCLKKDRYDAFMTSLYNNQPKWMMSHNLQKTLEPYAAMAGLNRAKMKECVTNAEGLKKINELKIDDMKKYNIEATPSVVLETDVRKEMITGVPERKSFEEKLDAMLKEAGPKPQSAVKKSVKKGTLSALNP